MRIPAAVLRRLSAGILCLAVFLLAVAPALAADTGTYGISDYKVTLAPQPDGQVRMTFQQTWRVLSGDIPWVTVGLPNSHFAVENHGGNASQVAAANSGGFTGVRIDLDRDYQPGETFAINFTVLQNNLLERQTSEGFWKIDYTPGWYESATIDHLQIDLVSPVDYQSYSSVSPMPANVNNNVITWERSNIPPGGRFNIVVQSTDGSFLTQAPPSTGGGGSHIVLYVVIGVLVVAGALIFFGIQRYRKTVIDRQQQKVVLVEKEMAEDAAKKKQIEAGFDKYVEKEHLQPDDQGRYYDRRYGDYVTPAIWAAIIASSYNRPSVTMGSGGRPSCVACACVACACACACACAGGGAAGCSRKTLHECPVCIGTETKIQASAEEKA